MPVEFPPGTGIYSHITRAYWVSGGMQNKPIFLIFEASYDNNWMTVQWTDGNGNAYTRKENVKDVTRLQDLTVSLEFEDRSEEFRCVSLDELQELQQLIEPFDIDLWLNPVAQRHRMSTQMSTHLVTSGLLEQAYNVVQQFESADTDQEQEEATNNVERLLATCDDGDLVFETIVVLRQMCVKKNLSRKFNEWREKYMQRAEREDPTPEELWYSPCNSKSELMEWLQKKLDREAPAITDEEVMSEAMGASTSSASVDRANADSAMRINAPLSCCAEKFKMELQRRSEKASNPFLLLL